MDYDFLIIGSGFGGLGAFAGAFGGGRGVNRGLNLLGIPGADTRESVGLDSSD